MSLVTIRHDDGTTSQVRPCWDDLKGKFNGQCDTCARPIIHQGMTPGYGRDDLGCRHCFMCCADHDRAYMRARGKIILYLSEEKTGTTPTSMRWKISNWPSSLEFFTAFVRKGYHNMAGRRYDVWFWFEGTQWHGVQYGDNTQILHCRRTKGR